MCVLCVCVHICPCRQVLYVGRMHIVFICRSVKSLCICKVYVCSEFMYILYTSMYTGVGGSD